jgi:hypothetical protein
MANGWCRTTTRLRRREHMSAWPAAEADVEQMQGEEEQAQQRWLHWRVDTGGHKEPELQLRLPACEPRSAAMCRTRDAPLLDVQLSCRSLRVTLPACPHHPACEVGTCHFMGSCDGDMLGPTEGDSLGTSHQKP